MYTHTLAHAHTSSLTPTQTHEARGLGGQRLRGAGLIECTLILPPAWPARPGLGERRPRLVSGVDRPSSRRGDNKRGPGRGAEPRLWREPSGTRRGRPAVRGLGTRARPTGAEGEQRRVRTAGKLFCQTLILTFRKGGGQAQRTRRARERETEERAGASLERGAEGKGWEEGRCARQT